MVKMSEAIGAIAYDAGLRNHMKGICTDYHNGAQTKPRREAAAKKVRDKMAAEGFALDAVDEAKVADKLDCICAFFGDLNSAVDALQNCTKGGGAKKPVAAKAIST